MKALDLSEDFINSSLYSQIILKNNNAYSILNTFFYKKDDDFFDKSPSLDCYCIKCNKKVTFTAVSDKSDSFKELYNQIKEVPSHYTPNDVLNVAINYLNKQPLFYRVYKCPYDFSDTHDIVFIFKIEGHKYMKIGQYPPMIDLLKPEIEHIKEYNQEIYNELCCSLNLSGQGMGIGAFVYLRRIIEKHIVIPAFNEKISNEPIELQATLRKQNSTFAGKFKYVKDKLPKFLAENENLFGVISRGVHSLTEEECNKYFNTLYQTIKVIINIKIREFKEEEEKKQLLLEINKINQDHPKH